MKKQIHLLIISFLFITLFSSCKGHSTNEESYYFLEYIGRSIINFPDWYSSGNFSYSEWHEWQSEDGKKLHKFASYIPNIENFNGYYRLLCRGQGIHIIFDNGSQTIYNLLWNYIPEFRTEEKRVQENENKDAYLLYIAYFPQNSDTEYNYSAFAKSDIFYTANASNNISLIKDNGYKTEFNYTLKLDEKELFNEKFTHLYDYAIEVSIPDWLRYKTFSQYTSKIYGQKFYGFEDFKSTFSFYDELRYRSTQKLLFPYFNYIMQLESETEDSVIYSFDGISPNQPKYLKIENLGGAEFLFSWYKDLNSEPVETSTQKGTGAF